MTESGATYWTCKTLARAVLLALCRARGHGLGNVPQEGGVILAANHESYLDPLLIGSALTRSMTTLARESLFELPVLSFLLPRIHAVPIRRNEPNTRLMRRSVELLRQGACFLMFPEGTRSLDGSFGKVHAGVGLLAERAGVPVVPTLVDGTFRAWSRNRRFPKPAPVRVYFERAIPPGAGAREISVRILRAWTERRKRIRANRTD